MGYDKMRSCKKSKYTKEIKKIGDERRGKERRGEERRGNKENIRERKREDNMRR